jgi:hypothetical protein
VVVGCSAPGLKEVVHRQADAEEDVKLRQQLSGGHNRNMVKGSQIDVWEKCAIYGYG